MYVINVRVAPPFKNTHGFPKGDGFFFKHWQSKIPPGQVQQRFEWPNYSSHSRKAPPLSEVMAAVVQVSTHLYGNRGNLCGFKVMPITHPTGRLISLKEAVPGKICKMPSITLHPGRREGYCKMLRCCPKMVDIARLKSWYEKHFFPQSFANRFGLS